MKAKLVSTLVAAALSSLAFAGEPVQLNATEMEGVTAAGFGFGEAGALAYGKVVGTSTLVTVDTQAVLPARTSELTSIRLVGTVVTSASAASAANPVYYP